MRKSLFYLFSTLNDSIPARDAASDQNLFGFSDTPDSFQYEQADIDFLICYFSNGFDNSLLEGKARELFELSSNAFDIFIHAWMSELSIEAGIIRFGRRVIAAAQAAGGSINEKQKRVATAKAAADCGDEDTLAVLNAAEKVQNEIHKMRGLLRFFPENDVYISKCAPDHFILPALGEYFSARFGETAWAIIDEKRGLCLNRKYAQDAEILFFEECPFAANRAGDEWEELWRHYHKTINNESRKNPSLQRQFMPKRYWKYLNEL